MAERSLYAGNSRSASGSPQPTIKLIADLATIKKSGNAILKVRVTEIDGRRFCDVRTFYVDSDAVQKASQKGITCTVDQLRELIPALIEAGKQLAAVER